MRKPLPEPIDSRDDAGLRPDDRDASACDRARPGRGEPRHVRDPREEPQIARLALATLLAVVAAGCGNSHPATTAKLAHFETATVGHVSDGDTLRLTDGRRVRIVQIDAPELETDCYGQQARRALLRLAAPGTRVTLESDPALDTVDRYGRLLRYIEIGRRDAGLALVAEGAAEPYFFHNDRGRHADELLRAAKRARAARRGLWGACPGARLDPGLGSITGPR